MYLLRQLHCRPRSRAREGMEAVAIVHRLTAAATSSNGIAPTIAFPNGVWERGNRAGKRCLRKAWRDSAIIARKHFDHLRCDFRCFMIALCHAPVPRFWHQHNVTSDGVNAKRGTCFKAHVLANHAWQGHVPSARKLGGH